MSDKIKKHQIVIVDDRFWKSVGRDAVSTCSLLSMIYVGVLIDSNALQWIAGLLWCLWIIGKIASHESKNTKTIGEARQYLEELEQNSGGANG